MSRLFKISFVTFTRGLILFVLMAMSIFAGLQLLLEPHANTHGGGAQDEAPFYQVTEPPIDSRNIVGVDVKWVSPLRMTREGIIVLACLYVILPFIYLLLQLMEKRLERGIVGKGSLGEDICLKPEAVERVINREVRAAVEDVTRVVHCEVTQGSRTARVRMSVAISDRSIVPQVQQRVRTVVRDALTRLIGYADGTQIAVKVVDVAGAGPGAVRRRPPQRTNRRQRDTPVDAVATREKARRETPTPPAIKA
ncbi:hypothetical protein IT570_12770 [Candidatus Sumerlaeota bacterium]|nr:hypothetical protein [Candidatus Sumerlaeota bacterium]